jgi:hypothetical protein
VEAEIRDPFRINGRAGFGDTVQKGLRAENECVGMGASEVEHVLSSAEPDFEIDAGVTLGGDFRNRELREHRLHQSRLISGERLTFGATVKAMMGWDIERVCHDRRALLEIAHKEKPATRSLKTRTRGQAN